ncbi:MAG: alpha/beta hydrolase [Halobacteriales archaeon]|nr:alpha/beta hydrolase [Halobacteriales archaeon]
MVKKGSLSLLKHANKLGPFKDPFALFVFSIGVEKYFHEHRPKDFPRVSTRGHIDTCRVRATSLTPEGRVGGALGVPKRWFLEDGHDETDYGTVGEIPGFTGEDEPPDEVVVFVHGWLSNEEAALGRMSLLRYSLEKNGYKHPVVGFTWDTDQTVVEWESGKIVARWNGPKLARFTADYAKRNPDTKIRYVSNSLGSQPVFEALRTLDDAGYEDIVESASIMGGTVPSGSVTLDGRYGDGIQNAVGDVYSYRTPGDVTLCTYYEMAEGTSAVGCEGAKGETHESYHDRCVGYVPDHFSFMLPTMGCIEEVVRDFGVEPPESLKDADVTKNLKAFRDVSAVENGTGNDGDGGYRIDLDLDET